MANQNETIIPLIDVPDINWKALKSKRLSYLTQLIDTYGTNILYSTDSSGFYPIHWAVISGKADMVEEMIRVGVSPQMKARIYDEPEPIHLAALEGHIRVIDLLLSHGVDINIKDNTGCTPLIRASMFGSSRRSKSSETVLHLISCGADIDLTDNNGLNSMHYAILHNNEETVHLLLNLGLDPNKTTAKGYRAIDFTTQCGNEYLMKLLAPLTENMSKTDLELMVIKYKKRKCRDSLTELLVLLARIVILSAVFSTLFWLYPQYILYYLPQTSDQIILNVSLIVMNALVWLSWYKVCTCDPGYLPINTSQYKQILESKQELGLQAQAFNKIQTDTNRNVRLCHTCRTVQTDRSTHCRHCSRCVASFDHHCIYLATCIGLYNRIAFFTLDLCMFFSGTLGIIVVLIATQKDQSLLTPYHWFNFCYCIKFTIIGAIMTICNIRRAAINLTQNEEIKSYRYRYLSDSMGRFINPYDQGTYWRNMIDYFSRRPYDYSKVKAFDY